MVVSITDHRAGGYRSWNWILVALFFIIILSVIFMIMFITFNYWPKLLF